MKKFVSFLLFAAAAMVLAQNFGIPSATVDGGGGTSTGSGGGKTFSVSGTIGQPDAAPVSSGGSFAVAGGFWAAFQTIQIPGAPVLGIRGAGSGTVQVFWPAAAAGWILQASPSMGPGSWADVTASPQTGGGDQFHSFNVTGSPHRYFRLRALQP